MAWRRFQISRTLGGVDNEEAKPEAGSVVAKLDKPEDKQFPKPKKNKELNLDFCQERQHFVISFLFNYL